MGITFSNETKVASTKVLNTEIEEHIDCFCLKMNEDQKRVIKRQLRHLIKSGCAETVYVYSERTKYTLNGIEGYNGSLVIAYSYQTADNGKFDLAIYCSHADSYSLSDIFNGVKSRIRGIWTRNWQHYSNCMMGQQAILLELSVYRFN